MRHAVRLAALAVLAGLAPAHAIAQGVPNLSGTWVLVPEKSDFGPMPAPQSRTDVIDHKEPALTIARTQVTAAGETTTSLVFAVDGKPHKNTVGQTELTSTLHWEGAVLVVVSLVNTPQGEVTLTDRYELSADGKTLTQARVISVPGQELSQTMVLEKKA
jgi:hypothetical protein